MPPKKSSNDLCPFGYGDSLKLLGQYPLARGIVNSRSARRHLFAAVTIAAFEDVEKKGNRRDDTYSCQRQTDCLLLLRGQLPGKQERDPRAKHPASHGNQCDFRYGQDLRFHIVVSQQGYVDGRPSGRMKETTGRWRKLYCRPPKKTSRKRLRKENNKLGFAGSFRQYREMEHPVSWHPSTLFASFAVNIRKTVSVRHFGAPETGFGPVKPSQAQSSPVKPSQGTPE